MLIVGTFRYTIVVFSNQASTRPKVIDEWKNKVPLFAKEVQITLSVYDTLYNTFANASFQTLHSEFLLLKDVTGSGNLCLECGLSSRRYMVSQLASIWMLLK